MIRSILVCAALTCAACGSDKKKDPPAAPAPIATPAVRPLFMRPPLAALPQAPDPTRTVGRGEKVVYPASRPLVYAHGAKRLDPPMRVQRVWAIPDRPLAAAAGMSRDGATVQMIDVDAGTIRWSDTNRCASPIVHTTTDRIVCAAWKGMKALDVDGGAVRWKSPLMFKAAWKRYAFGRDPEDPTRGSIIEVATGKVVVEVIAPPKQNFDDVKGLCASKRGFELYSWSAAGLMQRYHVARSRVWPVLVARKWRRRYGRRISKTDLCNATLLIELPSPGRAERSLIAVSRKSGKVIGASVAVFGWWPARAGSSIETATRSGVQQRSRTLKIERPLSAVRGPGRLVAQWNALRLVRGAGGTLGLLDKDGVRAWLAAPSRVQHAVITSRRLLAGSWLSPPQSAAEQLTLYDLPEPGDAAVSKSPLPPPAPARVPYLAAKKPPRVSKVPARVYSLDSAGREGVSHMRLSGTRLYAVTLEGQPSKSRGAGIAAFDFARKKWLWHKENACPLNAFVVGLGVAGGHVVCGAHAHYPARGALVGRLIDTGERSWTVSFPTLDAVAAAGDVVVAIYGDRASVVDAKTGEINWSVSADNGHVPRIVPLEIDGKTRVVVVERGMIVARDGRTGQAAWSVAFRGTVRRLRAVHRGVAVVLAAGELVVLSGRDGSDRSIGAWSPRWDLAGRADFVIDRPRGSSGEVVLRAHNLDGTERFRAAYAIEGVPAISGWRGQDPASPLLLVSYVYGARMYRLDPRSGALRGAYALPPRTVRGVAFSTVVGGEPVVGALLKRPLAIHLY